jgi:biopolymer transport protein ExbD
MRLRQAETKKARIEIIPMIDAIFFLLVFFMMTSLQMVQLDSERVALPQSSAPASQPEGAKIVVSLTKSGAFYVDRDKVEASSLVGTLAPKIARDPKAIVILNIDREQRIGGFARAFDLVKQANPARVMIAASPREPDALPAPPAAGGGE